MIICILYIKNTACEQVLGTNMENINLVRLTFFGGVSGFILPYMFYFTFE